ncbi:MAG: MFS transporter [Firmicutes bacterium]|nr:MFS transporter [Bacillota bacterium]
MVILIYWREKPPDVCCSKPYTYLTIILTVSAIWNALANPLFGQLSDRTKTRFGRRLPSLIFGEVPLGLFTWLTWTPPVQSLLPMAVQLGVVTFCFDSFYTLTVLNWTALFQEMFSSAEQRAAVSALRQAFGILALVVGVALTQSVAVWLGGWSRMGALFGTIAAATLLLSAWEAQENPTYAQFSLKAKAALNETFQNYLFNFYIVACFSFNSSLLGFH